MKKGKKKAKKSWHFILEIEWNILLYTNYFSPNMQLKKMHFSLNLNSSHQKCLLRDPPPLIKHKAPIRAWGSRNLPSSPPPLLQPCLSFNSSQLQSKHIFSQNVCVCVSAREPQYLAMVQLSNYINVNRVILWPWINVTCQSFFGGSVYTYEEYIIIYIML